MIEETQTTFLEKASDLLRETIKDAFGCYPYHIVGKTIDSVSKKATFTIKAKRLAMPVEISTADIVNDSKYFFGMSADDREKIEQQYRSELFQPAARIIEFPISKNEHNQYIFKILLIEECEIICGAASSILENQDLIEKISREDLIKLAEMAYEERYSTHEDECPFKKANIHILRDSGKNTHNG